jgi:hypothetical protein
MGIIVRRADTGIILKLIIAASLFAALLLQGIMQGNMWGYVYKGSVYPIELINLLLHPSPSGCESLTALTVSTAR